MNLNSSHALYDFLPQEYENGTNNKSSTTEEPKKCSQHVGRSSENDSECIENWKMKVFTHRCLCLRTTLASIYALICTFVGLAPTFYHFVFQGRGEPNGWPHWATWGGCHRMLNWCVSILPINIYVFDLLHYRYRFLNKCLDYLFCLSISRLWRRPQKKKILRRAPRPTHFEENKSKFTDLQMH